MKTRARTLTTTLIPAAAGLQVDQIAVASGQITVALTSTRPRSACPECGCLSARVHSRYRRTLADLPWGHCDVRLRLTVRKFVCLEPLCPRRIFTERLPALVAPYARRTARLTDALRLLALTLGGEGAARLGARLGLGASPATFLRLARAAPLPAAPTPRVLGVDDWAWQKGRRYGTIVVDLERHRVVDLLPDRTADGLAAWLADHPGVAIIARDRGGAYADGARQGAPEAVQVADRWHLLHNLGEAVEELLDRHRRELRRLPPPADLARPGETAAPAVASPQPTAQVERARLERRAQRLDRYRQALALREQGLTQCEIARAVGVSVRTLSRFFAAGGFPERRTRRRSPSPLDPHRPHLDRRWAEGCRRGAVLWREICAQGYTGARATVYTHLTRLRRQEARAAETAATAAAESGVAARGTSPRRARWLFLRPAADLDPAERRWLTALHEHCPDTAGAYRLAHDFLGLIRERRREDLAAWLAAAEGSGVPELRRFAAGLRRDQAAVEAALTHEWSAGQTEGQITRLKLIKRAMYGRGKLDLLRSRVLHAA